MSKTFFNMTRRSLQLITLWGCLILGSVTSQFLIAFNYQTHVLFWVGIIYPIVATYVGMKRQIEDDKKV